MNVELWGITWASAGAVIYVPLLLIICGLAIYRFNRVHTIIDAIAAHKHHSVLFNNYSSTRRIVRLILYCLGSFFLFLALAHPQWGKKEEKIIQEGRDVFIALDISRSMLAQDIKPNRLACAKQKIKQLLSKLSCERVGLILFSGAPFVQCPLTSDYGAFHMFLDSIDAESVSSGTTSLDQAIYRAVTLFSTMPEKKNKILVVITDGEDFSSNLSGVKQKAQELGLHIFTLGIGTEQGAPIPLFDDKGKQSGVQYDEKGSIVISRLNEGILKTLSADTGAHYIHVTPDSSKDIQELVDAVRRYEKERLEDKTVARYEEQYPYFLFISLCCFIVEWLL